MPHSPFDGQQEKTGAVTLLLAVNKCFAVCGPGTRRETAALGEARELAARCRPEPHGSQLG
jgi:hypothetical protein